ncbi:MAG: MBL fold hydrolase [Clostridiales bacterium GWF2_38_85]|nr:MAG: MBL fold hydrolase [Clostridiales bacterium GWF2_38_85]HBL83336.1 MBL fold hydrolase [Clostridiales bacterium]
MNLTFYGAAKNVTGSCFMLTVNEKKIMIDCGMKQGCSDCDNKTMDFVQSEIDYVLVTHAHIDHSGRLPLIVKYGYTGQIIATGATCSLLEIMLRDSAKIQEMDAKWENQKGKRAGHEFIEPLYTMEDTEKTLLQLEPHKYNERIKICEGVSAEFIDGGHLLGSASITLYLDENGVQKIIAFSGDIGNLDQPIIRDPIYLKKADYVVMESTYGNRNHDEIGDYAAELAQIFESTFIKGGNIVIPSFSVGRTQELLYFIREMKERKLVKSIPDFPVYVDSPLSIAATNIYSGDLTGYADKLTDAIIAKGQNPLRFNNLHMTETSDESKLINSDLEPKVIISSSGMCEAGRIRHHLKHNLWRGECSIVFVGYQANGTLGRIILNGVKKVKLFGEEIAVKAEIYNFSGLSAHADRNGLYKWISAFEENPENVFLVHGEEEATISFKELLDSNSFETYIPNPKTIIDLVNNKVLDSGELPRKKPDGEQRRYISSAYATLEAAMKHLISVVEKHKQAANKEISKFASQIEKLANRWDFKN